MKIVPYSQGLHASLFEIWRRGVKKTHTFLSNEDYEFYARVVDEQALPGMEVWAALGNNGAPVGFVGMQKRQIEMLFVDPAVHRMGVGTELLDFAVKIKKCTKVDVNEQNHQARVFYKKYGFVEISRSERDERGKPYPLIHLELGPCPKAG